LRLVVKVQAVRGGGDLKSSLVSGAICSKPLENCGVTTVEGQFPASQPTCCTNCDTTINEMAIFSLPKCTYFNVKFKKLIQLSSPYTGKDLVLFSGSYPTLEPWLSNCLRCDDDVYKLTRDGQIISLFTRVSDSNILHQ